MQDAAVAIRAHATRCPYLRGPKQADDAQDGWDVTGDTFLADPKGDLQITARNDDMFVDAAQACPLQEQVKAAIAPCKFPCA